MGIIGRGFIAALLLASPVICGAQADAPVARPAVKEGDRWKMRRIDYWQNKVTGSGETRISFANEKVIQGVVTGLDGTERDASWTAEWNALATADGNVFSPHSGLLQFPLQVGASYKVGYELRIPRLGAFHVVHERTVKVVGWEEVEVPAGKFRALKIEATGTYQRLDTSISGTAKDVIWYVPQVKRWVKTTFEDATFRGRNNWFGFELVEYRVQ